MSTSVKVTFVRVSISLLFYNCVSALIIPEELPTILSLIYSNIPPIKKGTDSRIGVGFRLGEHADFQVLVELGPQTETDPIGTNESKKRRDAMLSAAIKGELGPLAQAVAKYQMERRIRKELEKLKVMEEKLQRIGPEKKDEQPKTAASEWLAKWSKEMIQPPEDQVPSEQIPVGKIVMSTDGKIRQKSAKRPAFSKDKAEQLKQLYQTSDDSKLN